MKLKLRSLLIAACVIVQSTVQATETPFFWDDFDRTDLYETDVNYFLDPTPEEELTLVDGSLSLVPLVREYPNLWLTDVDYDRIRMETSFRFVDAPNGGTPFFYFAAGENTDEASDWAGVSADGRMIPGVGVNGTAVFDQSRSIAPYREMVSSDIHMVVEFDNDRHSITAWLDGEDPDPGFTLSETRITSEIHNLGLIINPDSQLNSSILIRHFAILPFVEGDLNGSDQLDAGDIDLISGFLQQSADDRLHSRIRVYDLDNNGEADPNDRQFLISELIGTYLGDSNLDGEFNSTDFVTVFQAGQYEDHLVGNSTWETGDWNGDAEFDSSDFVAAFQEGGYEKGPRVAAQPVPEPGCHVQLVATLLLGSFRCIRIPR